MIHLRLPGEPQLEQLHQECRRSSFSYPEVGATAGALPSGYNIDRSSTVLGQGREVFELARQALRNWENFRLSWVRPFPQAAPATGVQVAVVARVVGLWWVNVSRVIDVIDEPDRYAFTYGTLSVHAETGEERFQVRRDPDTDVVEYDILAFSRPRHILARLAYPLSRAMQHRFARESLAALRASVGTGM